MWFVGSEKPCIYSVPNRKQSYNKDHYTIRVNHPGVVKEMILQKPELFNDFELVKGRMDDVFLNVTGNKLLGGEQS